MILRLVVISLSLLPAANGLAQSIAVEPGLWMQTTKTAVDGRPQPDKIDRRCFKPDQAHNIVATLTAPTGPQQQGCKTDHRLSGNVLSMSAGCDQQSPEGPVTFRSKGQYTIESPTRITGKVSFRFTIGAQATTLNITVEAERIGVCF